MVNGLPLGFPGLVEGREGPARVGRFHLADRVFPSVRLADVEAAQLIVEDAVVRDLNRGLPFPQTLGDGESRRLTLGVRRDRR